MPIYRVRCCGCGVVFTVLPSFILRYRRSVATWQQVRSQLEQHRLKRVKQQRFRRSPSAYLVELKSMVIQLTLPV